MSGTNRQPPVPEWLRRLLRNPWAPLMRHVEQDRLRSANAVMPRG